MLKIVLIDDDHLVTQALATIINAQNDLQVVATGHNGADAINSYQKFHPDVLLLDIRMPQESGLEAAGKILQLDPSAKILFLTTFSDNDYIQEAMKLGVKGYLIKQNLNSIVPAIHTAATNQSVFSNVVMQKLQEHYQKMDNVELELTEREQEVLILVAQGQNNKEIAHTMSLSEGTIRNYISQLLDKTGLRDRTQLAIFYYQNYK